MTEEELNFLAVMLMVRDPNGGSGHKSGLWGPEGAVLGHPALGMLPEEEPPAPRVPLRRRRRDLPRKGGGRSSGSLPS